MSKARWIWQPHAGHFILGDKCKFVLNTYLGNGYLVSTVGELWNEEAVRRIHAEVHNPAWYEAFKHEKGDTFDRKYFKEFGYEALGFDRLYETMVFKAIPLSDDECGGCEYGIESGSNLDFAGYKTAKEAREGHLAMCAIWDRKRK